MGLIESVDLDRNITILGLFTITLHEFVSIVLICCQIPLTIGHIVSGYIIFKHRNNKQISNFVHKRHKNLFLLWYCVNTYFVCFHMYIIAFVQLYFYPESQNDLIESLCWAFGYLFFVSSILCTLTRAWRLYFYYNYQIVQIRKLWKQHLYSYNSWFIKYKQLYNIKFLFKIGIIFAFTSSIFMFVVAITTHVGLLFHAFGLFVFVTAAIFLLVLVYQLNKESRVDNFWIRKEINYTTIIINSVLGCFMIPYFVIQVSLIQMYIIGVGVSLGSVLMSFMLMYGVLKLVRQPIKPNPHQSQQQVASPSNIPQGVSNHNATHITTTHAGHIRATHFSNKNYHHTARANNANVSSQISSRTRLTIHKILQDKRGINQFADFLVREFCCENLLFVIAIVQYKQQIQSKIKEKRQQDKSKQSEKGKGKETAGQKAKKKLAQHLTRKDLTQNKDTNKDKDKDNTNDTSDASLQSQNLQQKSTTPDSANSDKSVSVEMKHVENKENKELKENKDDKEHTVSQGTREINLENYDRHARIAQLRSFSASASSITPTINSTAIDMIANSTITNTLGKPVPNIQSQLAAPSFSVDDDTCTDIDASDGDGDGDAGEIHSDNNINLVQLVVTDRDTNVDEDQSQSATVGMVGNFLTNVNNATASTSPRMSGRSRSRLNQLQSRAISIGRDSQSKLDNLSISNDIPLLEIISQNSNNISKQIELIINKYIMPSSDLMVNVSSDVRNDLIQFCKDLKQKQEHNTTSMCTPGTIANHYNTPKPSIFKTHTNNNKNCNNDTNFTYNYNTSRTLTESGHGVSDDDEQRQKHFELDIYQLNEYHCVFDDALLEIFRLLQSTFLRFKTTQEYVTLSKLIVASENNVRNKVRRLSISLSEKMKESIMNN